MTVHPVPKKPRRPRSRQPLKRGGRIRARNQKRHSREWRRAYGSVERVEFVKGLPCVACGIVGYSDNAHVESGGTARKADADKIAPLCGRAVEEAFLDRVGCHTAFHALGREWIEARYSLDLQQCAAETEAAWQAHLNLQEPTE
jgi:hypothetical protein